MLENFIKKINKLPERHDDTKSLKSLEKNLYIEKSLKKNLTELKRLTGESSDMVFRTFYIGNTKAAIVYIDGLVSVTEIEESVIKTLVYGVPSPDWKPKSIDDIIYNQLISSEVQKSDLLNALIDGFLMGDTALLIDGFGEGAVINTKGFQTRSITDPQTDSVIRGPREGFVENIRTNTALLRRKIRNTGLKFDCMEIGRQTKTKIAIGYIDDVADPELIENIKKRISKIDTDAIIDSGYIEQYIEDNPLSVFSTIAYTEKPDIAAGKILEGRAAIIVDGSPFVLTAPSLFVENFKSPEDYYIGPVAASMIRFVRYLSYFISILCLPAYVAFTTFHQELIPTAFLYTMAAAEAGTPFPSFFEALLMIIVFEILKESGVRLPKPVGQAVSIVGALVIGESAVSAGIIGAPMVIAVAITAVSAFVIPNQANTIVVLRYFLLVLGGTMGGFGIVMGLLTIYIHLSNLKSFGVPFLAPYSPLRTPDLKDSIVRMPIWAMLTRPTTFAHRNPRRQKFSKSWESSYEKD
ncbi:MAG: spore germination protein [Clostridia bacterium]|nr:spore germination protein [Clostridia bacterium]